MVRTASVLFAASSACLLVTSVVSLCRHLASLYSASAAMAGLGGLVTSLCPHSPLWNSSRTWNTTDPDFTACFRQTVLPSLSLLYLLLLAPLETVFCCRSHCRPAPWSGRNVVRTLGIYAVMAVTIYQLVRRVLRPDQLFVAELFSHSAEIFTFIIAFIFNITNMRRGVTSSGIIFGFWTISFLCQSIKFASAVRFDDEPEMRILVSVKYGVVSLVYLLHFWADAATEEDRVRHGVQPSPYHAASFPNKLVFAWMSPFLYRGWRSALRMEDLFDLSPSLRCATVSADWARSWRRLAAASPRASVVWALASCFGLTYLWSALLQLLATLLTQVCILTVDILHPLQILSGV